MCTGFIWFRRGIGEQWSGIFEIDVRVSVHHSIIHIENPARCNNNSKFYFIFI